MSILTPAQIKQGLANAGFPTPILDTMTAILLAESGGNTQADSGAAFGVAQIGNSHGYSKQQLSDPAFSFQVAKQIFDTQGITAWDTYSYLPPTPGCAHPDPATGECFVGPGNGSFLQFLGVTNSTTPVTAGTPFTGDLSGTGTGSGSGIDYSLFGWGPGNIIPSPGDVGKKLGDIWNTVTGSVTGAPAKAASAVASGVVASIQTLAQGAWNFLSPLFVRAGFFFLGVVVLGIGGIMLAAPNIQTNVQAPQASSNKTASVPEDYAP